MSKDMNTAEKQVIADRKPGEEQLKKNKVLPFASKKELQRKKNGDCIRQRLENLERKQEKS